MIGTGNRISGFVRMAFVLFQLIFAAACARHEPETGMVLSVPAGITLTLQDGNSALLVWEPVTGASHYYVVMHDSENGSKIVELESVTETAILFTDLESGSYYCRVRAIDGMKYSDFAMSDTITVSIPETDPDNPDAGADEPGAEDPDDGADDTNHVPDTETETAL